MQKSIEITTTQNVTIEYELASLRDRILAWLLDALIVTVGYIIFVVIISLIFSSFFEGGGWGIALGISSFLLYFLYNILMEILNRGQTFGKKALEIKVVRLDGKDPEWSDVVLRALLQLVDALGSFGVIGAMLIKTTGKSQRLGDMAANTTVIRAFSSRNQFRLDDILSIASLGSYQPAFPQVRNLSEQDMIFIKNVISRHQHYPNAAHAEVVDALIAHLLPRLELTELPHYPVEFLRTLLRDYIVLTR